MEESAQGQEREIPQAVAHARPPTTKTRKGASGDMTRLRGPDTTTDLTGVVLTEP